MQLTGLSATVLLELGAALGAVVVVFYILKLKRRAVPVPFAHLWERILRDKEASTLMSQLKRLLSLLLQLALLALMLLALGDPRPTRAATEGRHLVVLVDASASMQALDGDAAAPGDAAGGSRAARSRLVVGKERVRDIIRKLSGSDTMLIAQMDAAVTPLSTMTRDIAALEEALDQVHAVDAATHVVPGLRFALDALTGMSQPEIVVVSDGAFAGEREELEALELGDVELSYVPVGSGSRNVAITAFSVRRYPLDKSRYEVLLEVTNTGDSDAEVDLELYGDSALTDIVSLRLGPGETTSRFYPNLSGADHSLEARLKMRGGSADLLAVDNRAYALLPARKRARVQVVTAGNMYLEAALLLDEYLDVTTIAPKDFPAAGSFDVTIFDGVAPPPRPECGQLFYLNPPPGADTPFKVAAALRSDKRYTLGFDEIDTKHPLMQNLMLGDVNVARAHALEGEKGDQAVAKSFKGTLLLSGRRQGVRFAALGFDVRDSDLPLRISWPLLLLNIINDFRQEDVNYLSSFRTGAVWHVPAAADSETAELHLPSGSVQTVPVKDGRAVFMGQWAGIYQLTVGSGEQAEQTSFAGNLSDVAESSIAPSSELDVGRVTAGEVAGFTLGVRRELWAYFLLAVLLMTGVEWLTYHRRVTV